MAKYSVDILINEQFLYSRGAVFDKESKNIYFVDAASGEVIKYNTIAKTTEKRKVEVNLTVAIPTAENDDHLLIVGSNKLYHYTWSTGEFVTLHENSFTDVYMTASVDSKGRLWLGTMDQTFHYGAGLYCLQSDRNLLKKVGNKSEVSSIVWSPDNKKMYVTDPGRVTIFMYDFNAETGNVSNEQELISFGKRSEFKCSPDFQITSIATLPLEGVFEALSKNEMPGALLMTKNGSLWVSCYHTGRLVRLNTTKSCIEEQILIPALTPMSMAYAGENGEEIVVLTVSSFTTEEMKRQSPHIGKVFAVRKVDGTGFDYYSNSARFALKSVSFNV